MVTSREDVDLKERDKILVSLKNTAGGNIRNAGNKIVQDQTIIVLGGACGIGKTRLGHEFFKKMKKNEIQELHSEEGQKDEEGEQEGGEINKYQNSCYIFLRMKENTEFDPQKLEQLILDKTYANADIIFLHFDEIQRLSQRNFNFLRQKFGDFMSNNKSPKLIPIFSGVPAGLMADKSQEDLTGYVSNSRFHIIRLTFLSYESSKIVLQAFCKMKDLHFDKNLESILASLGGIPRAIEKLSESLQGFNANSRYAYENLYENLKGKILKLYGSDRWKESLSKVAEKKGIKDYNMEKGLEELINISLANQTISLTQKLYQDLTIEELEQVGFLVLHHLGNQTVKIHIPLIFFDILGDAISNLIPDDFRKPLKLVTWDSFEVNKDIFDFYLIFILKVFMTFILKIQINALCSLKQQPITLGDAFPHIIWSQSAKTLPIKFQEIDNVVKSVHQIPGSNYGNLKKIQVHESSQLIDLTKGETFLINCDKAPSFDACLLFKKHLLAIQFKHTSMLASNQSTISVKLLTEEIKKSKESCKKCEPKLGHIFLAISNRKEEQEKKKSKRSSSKVDADYDDAIEKGISLEEWVTTKCEDYVGLVFDKNFNDFCAAFSGFAGLIKSQSTQQNPKKRSFRHLESTEAGESNKVKTHFYFLFFFD
jgi:hypothetical protein